MITGAGVRLAYVVVALEGTVEREKVTWSKKDGLKTKTVAEPAGFMVYFPRGHALRLRDKAALARYGLDKRPPIINLQGLNDPNSPLGKMLMSQDEEIRHSGYIDLEKAVINLATAKSGPMLMPEQVQQAQQVAA